MTHVFIYFNYYYTIIQFKNIYIYKKFKLRGWRGRYWFQTKMFFQLAYVPHIMLHWGIKTTKLSKIDADNREKLGGKQQQ